VRATGRIFAAQIFGRVQICSRRGCRSEIPAFIAAEPQHHGGSPRIDSGEERFSAPIKRRLSRRVLALGTSWPARQAGNFERLPAAKNAGLALRAQNEDEGIS
jgi:hypothetical protein